MDASDPSQTKHLVASEHSQKDPDSETLLAEVNEIIVGSGEDKDVEEVNGTATSVNKEVTYGDIDKKVMAIRHHSRQGPESVIATGDKNEPESEAINGGDPSKKCTRTR
jgi:hypothetical protein